MQFAYALGAKSVATGLFSSCLQISRLSLRLSGWWFAGICIPLVMGTWQRPPTSLSLDEYGGIEYGGLPVEIGVSHSDESTLLSPAVGGRAAR